MAESLGKHFADLLLTSSAGSTILASRAAAVGGLADDVIRGLTVCDSLGVKRHRLIAVFYGTDVAGEEDGAGFAFGAGNDAESTCT
jgi:hypothetical protein